MKATDSLTSNATTLIDRPFEDYTLLNSLKATTTTAARTQDVDARLDSLPSFFWGYLVYSSGTRFGEKRELRTRSRVQRAQEPFNLYLSKAHRFCTLAVKRGTNKIFLADSMTGNTVKQCTFVWDGRSGKSFGIKDETSGRTAVGGIFLEKDQICPLQDGSIISFAKANGTVQDYGRAEQSLVFYQAATKPPKSYAELYEGDTQAGAGATACVKVARQKANGGLYAVKLFKFYENAVSEHTMREVKALSRLSHPGICELYEVYHGALGRISEFVIEYVTGSDLQSHLEKFGAMEETKARHISFQLCNTLAYIHSQGVIHGDIKPGNILLIEYIPPKVKINDFGSAQPTTEGSAAPRGVTLGYAAPEATRLHPLTAQDAYDMQATARRKLGLPLNEKGFRLMNTEACDLIKAMLIEDPRERTSAASALEHAWLMDYHYQPTTLGSTNATDAYSDLTPTERCSPPPHDIPERKHAQHPSPSVEFKPGDLKCPSCHQKISSRMKNLNTSAPLPKCIKCRKMDQKNLTRVRTEQPHRAGTTRRILKPGDCKPGKT
ncbi:kinase-like protein [Agrocybe pediades]|nr:kinase-like protein [Agrocybe pediades]